MHLQVHVQVHGMCMCITCACGHVHVHVHVHAHASIADGAFVDYGGESFRTPEAAASNSLTPNIPSTRRL